MSPEIHEAIENARSASLATGMYRPVEPARRISFTRLYGLFRAIVRELPDDMTIRELCVELETLAPDEFEDDFSDEARP